MCSILRFCYIHMHAFDISAMWWLYILYIITSIVSVLSKVHNFGWANGLDNGDVWVVCITFGWSVYAVVRNDDKTLTWLLCCLFPTITRAYITTRFLFKALKPFWNVTSGSAPMLPNHLWTLKSIGVFFQTALCCLMVKNSSEIVSRKTGVLNVQVWVARSIYG